ncbi:MAG TPA: nuclear transport factor 2 family protein [Thermoleophilaceae bacterium]
MSPVCWEIQPLERARRGLDEWFEVAAPGLARRFFAVALRLPKGSAPRRALLTSAARVSLAANNRRDYASVLASYHPEAELLLPEAEAGFEASYRGKAALRAFFEQWKSGFGAHRYEGREIADAGGGRFALRFLERATIAGSDAEVTNEMAAVVTVEDGMVVRQENFNDWSEALGALAVDAEPVRWEVQPLERARRGLDERLRLAAPSLARRFFAAVTRLPKGSSPRRAVITTAVRVATAANNRNDYASMLVSYHPDAELIPPDGGQLGVGFDASYRGHAGVRAFFEQWKSGFGEHLYHVREIADAGGGHFAVRYGLRGTIAGSQAAVMNELAAVITVDDGLVTRHENFRDWSEALEVLSNK